MCGKHKKKFKVKQGRSLLYYMCPNHQMEYREDGDVICNNFVSRNGIKMIKEEVELLYEINELTIGYKDTVLINKRSSTYKGKVNSMVCLDYEILDINEDYIAVGVVNRKEKKNENDI